ncbi:MAG: hypothetical protein LBR33_00275 [Propionibacteriaceae bacterium]|nr:hypothetical protein [Propionibacteriaceae bacterium]
MTPDELPDALADLLDEAITLDNPMLPRAYADPSDPAAFADFQERFRGGPIAGWAESWVALAANATAEPFFADVDEDPDFPVYFAYRGASRWTPLAVADSVADFAYLVEKLQDLEADPREAAEWLAGRVDCDNELWGDVWSVYSGDVTRLEDRRRAVAITPEDFVYGSAVVTRIGPQRDAVLAAMAELLGLEAGAVADLAREGDVTVQRDRFVNLRDTIDRLSDLGARVEFQPR